MPPWGAQDTSECKPRLPWRGDERLTEQEILTLQRWEAAGAPEGDPSDAPVEVEPVQSLELTPTVELATLREYRPSISSGDEFRCFVIDAPELKDGGYVSAINVVPGNRKIVHHVTVFADVGGVVSQRAGEDGSFDCSDSVGTINEPIHGMNPELTWLLAWAPGARPLELPSNLGIEVRPNSKIVMEVHYSMGGTMPDPDRTRLQIVMAPTKPEYKLSSWGTGNFGSFESNGDGLLPGEADRDGVVEFRIPANARNHVEQMQQTCGVEGPLPIFGVRAHAHFAAVDLKIDVIRNGVEECLLQDRWDAHWQRVYTYDAPFQELPMVRGGDKIRVRCTYDNSMMNRRLAQELWSRGMQPTDIQLGNWSMSEMCMAEILYIEKTR